MYLSAADVEEMLKLIDESPVDELRLQTDSLEIFLRRKGEGEWTQQRQELRKPVIKEIATPDNKTAEKLATARASSEADGRIAVPTPLPGTFYRAPKPGEAPFVEVGEEVNENTVVAIVETMKLMNSILANTRGTVAEICYEDAEFADKDMVLMWIEPET